MRWLLSHIFGGVIRWIVGIVLTLVCLTWGFAPEEFFSAILSNPPAWLSLWQTRLAVVLVGVLIITIMVFIKLFRPSAEATENREETSRQPITELRELAAAAGWDTDVFSTTVGDNDFGTFSARLKQAAADGIIRIWGRKYDYDKPENLKEHDTLIEIEPAHFHEFGFDVSDLAQASNWDIFTHKLGHYRHELRDRIYRDLHIDFEQAKAWFAGEGKAPPGASFNIQGVSGTRRIGDYDCIVAFSVQNVETTELTNCLVQLEQVDRYYPDNMPMPLVLRTEGQIDGSRTGRFTLSPRQPKTIPVLFRGRIRSNEWFFFDEHAQRYFMSRRPIRLLIGVYGGQRSGKILLNVDLLDDGTIIPNLKTVPDDFELAEIVSG